MAASPEHWSLDKRVPIAVIVALLGNIGALIVGATMTVSSVNDHDARIEKTEAQLLLFGSKHSELLLSLARQQESNAALRDTIQELRIEVRQLRELASRRADADGRERQILER